MVAGADRNVVVGEDGRDVVRMHAFNLEGHNAVMVRGVLAAQNDDMRNLFGAFNHSDGQSRFPFLNGVKAKVLNVMDGRFQSDGARRIDGARFELMRELRIDLAVHLDIGDHFSAGHVGRHLLEPLLFAVEDTNGHGAEHLVAGEGQEIHVEVLYVHRHMRHALRAVHDKGRAVGVTESRKRFNVILPPEDVGDLCNGHDFRLRGQKRGHLVR